MILIDRKTLVTLSVAVVAAAGAFCDDAAAVREAKRGAELAANGDYKAAAEAYLESEHFADDVVMKANALKNAAKYFRRSEYLYREFKAIENILISFPDHINFKKAVRREFDIGDKFFAGHRDPAFIYMPWVKETDKTIEIYSKALERGPFSKRAPEIRLRLGRLYIKNDQLDKALKTLRDVIKMYPDTPEQKFAYFELASALVQLAEQGDGDGKYAKEAQETLKTIIDKYPDDPETVWAKQTFEEARTIVAKRLFNMSKFYYRNNNRQAAERYLNEVIRDYHDTEYAENSEELLAVIDKEYKPSGKEFEEKRIIKYKMGKMPADPEKILVVPENSGGKWLLPIEDVGLGDDKKKDDDHSEETEKAIRRGEIENPLDQY